MTPQQVHHARIMIECGCTIEDVAVTLGLKLYEAIYGVASSLKANPQEQARVRKIAAAMRLPAPAIHKEHRSVDVRTIKRRAA